MKKEEMSFIEIGRGFETPIYKSEMVVGNITIRFIKRFNWLNRMMFKIFFGLDIRNTRK